MYDDIEYFIDNLIYEVENSIKRILKFWKNNSIYMLCSAIYYVICSLIFGGTWQSFLIVFITYAVSLVIGFSKIGEKILRLLNRVRPLETLRETEYLQPLFDEVYQHSKLKYKRLRKIEICVIDNMTVNAMALGLRTIAVTKGAIQTFSEEELKAIIGHEIAHIAHGDTLASLYVIVGNGILSVLLLFSRLFVFLLDILKCSLSNKFSIFSLFILLFKLFFEVSILIFNFGMQVILSINSRKNEFRADKFSYQIGYDTQMIEALYLLEKISLGDNSTIIQKMIASHPRITLRIKKLEELDELL